MAAWWEPTYLHDGRHLGSTGRRPARHRGSRPAVRADHQPRRGHRRRLGARLAGRGRRRRTLSSSSSTPPAWSLPRKPAKPRATTTPLLISEAVRGEGAVLVDAAGHRFMPDYHPDAELAPRDVVSRSIALHLAARGPADGHGIPRRPRDRSSRGARLPGPALPHPQRTHPPSRSRLDPEPVPVSPAAHYWMGGVATDLTARTASPGSTPPARWRAPGSRAPTGWPATRCSKAWCSAAAPLRGSLVRWRVADGVPLRANSAAGGLALTHAAGTPPVDQSDAPLARQRRCRDLRRRYWVRHFELDPMPAPVSWEFESLPGRGLGRFLLREAGVFSRGALRRLMTAKAGVLRDGVRIREAGGRWLLGCGRSALEWS